MKTIISEYFGALVAIITGIAIMVLFMYSYHQKSSIFTLTKEFVEAETKNLLEAGNNESFNAYMSQKKLEISYVEERPIYENILIDPAIHFTATDEKGNLVSYEVEDVCDREGKSCYKSIVTEEGWIFPKAGIYQVLIHTKGADCKNVSAVIPFPVKKKGV